MPGPLTINERDYADDKQLIVGGGSGDSPVKVATLDFRVSDRLHTSAILYFPAEGGFPDSIGDTGLDSDDLYSVVVPQVIEIAPELADALEITGDASVILDGNYGYIYVTGNCTIAGSTGQNVNI